MIIDNIFVTDISATEQTIGVMLKETAESKTAYIINHNYPKGTADSVVKSAIQAKIDAFVLPQSDNSRDGLIADLLSGS